METIFLNVYFEIYKIMSIINWSYNYFISDSYADLKDVVYQWNVDGEVVSYSKTPLLNHRFPTSGLYNLTVVAYNLGK